MLFDRCGDRRVDVYWVVKDFHPEKDIPELRMHGEIEVECSIG